MNASEVLAISQFRKIAYSSLLTSDSESELTE